MENKIKMMVENADYNDLLLLKDSIKKKGFDFEKLIKETIKEKQKQHESYCVVCGEKLKPESHNNFTLLFGPADFKKKASFCAIDCLDFFINRLKMMKGIKEVANVAREEEKLKEQNQNLKSEKDDLK